MFNISDLSTVLSGASPLKFLSRGYANLGPPTLDNIWALVKTYENNIAESWQLNSVTVNLPRLYSFKGTLM